MQKVRWDPIHINFYENSGPKVALLHDMMKINPGCRIIDSTIGGPFYLNRYSQVGPNVKVGKYFGMNEHAFVARANVGAFCAIGARTAINPFNHPTSWLSTHEFQYHPQSFDWVDEYNDIERLDRTPDMFEFCNIGNDVWMGHNANIMPGTMIGDGAVIAAGSVVTKDVPPYAIVAGVPAKIIRYRFDEKTIERLAAVRWWDLELPQLSGINFRDIQASLSQLEDIRAQMNACESQ